MRAPLGAEEGDTAEEMPEMSGEVQGEVTRTRSIKCLGMRMERPNELLGETITMVSAVPVKHQESLRDYVLFLEEVIKEWVDAGEYLREIRRTRGSEERALGGAGLRMENAVNRLTKTATQIPEQTS